MCVCVCVCVCVHGLDSRVRQFAFLLHVTTQEDEKEPDDFGDLTAYDGQMKIDLELIVCHLALLPSTHSCAKFGQSATLVSLLHNTAVSRPSVFARQLPTGPLHV